MDVRPGIRLQTRSFFSQVSSSALSFAPVMVSILPISCADIHWMSLFTSTLAQEMGNMLTITGGLWQMMRVLLPGLIICLKLCSRDGEHIAHLLCGHPLDVSVHIDSRTGDGQYAHHHGRLKANDETRENDERVYSLMPGAGEGAPLRVAMLVSPQKLR